MSTASAGSPSGPEPEESSGVPWAALGLGILALVLIALIGPRVVGVLFGIMAPPEPPVPDGARLLGYERQVYGVDTWTYDVEQDICQLVTFYEAEGGVCPVVPLRCLPEGQDLSNVQRSDDYTAICSGDVEFSIFAMRWRFAIPLRSTVPERLQFTLSREVSWTGDLPPAADRP